MSEDLLDAKAAIQWAVAQLPTLQQRLLAWRTDKPYSIRIDTDTEPGKKLYRLSNIKPVDPLINAEVGAIVHSIRSSLDLLACTLAVRNRRSPGSTYFPIWKSEADFLVPQGKKPNGSPTNPVLEKIERLSEIDQAVIKNLRPYPGPNGNPTLCALHDLDITRKHRRLLNVFRQPRGIGLSFPPNYSTAYHFGHWRGFNEETVLIWTDASEPDGDLNIGMYIALDEAGPMQGMEITAAIRNFASLAEAIICLFD